MSLRVGVIGLGYAGTTHLECFSAHPDCKVVALAGLERERLAALAAEADVPYTHAHWQDLVDRDDLDVVSIGLPNALHAQVAVTALQSGKHVLCEKPLARTTAEAASMVAAAEANDRVLHTAFNHRYRGDVEAVRGVVDAGRLGRVYHARAWWMRRRGIPGVGTWFTNKELAGGGPLIDLGVHVLDIALHLLGDPAVVRASAAAYDELGSRGIGVRDANAFGGGHSGYQVEDFACALLRLADGATLRIDAAWAVHASCSNDFGVALYGAEAGVEIAVRDHATADTVRLFSPSGDEALDVGPTEGHAGVVRDFVDAIAGGDWTAHRGRVGLQRAAVVEACYRSAAGGREVDVEVTGTPPG